MNRGRNGQGLCWRHPSGLHLHYYELARKRRVKEEKEVVFGLSLPVHITIGFSLELVVILGPLCQKSTLVTRLDSH
jgi:hypothetical protein